MVVGDGFEPSKAVPADLQSAPFSHSGIPPGLFTIGAGNGSRTRVSSLEGCGVTATLYPRVDHSKEHPHRCSDHFKKNGADGGS